MTTASDERASGRFGRWLAEAGTERAWVNALVAFVIGALFGVFLRTLTVAGLVTGLYLPLAGVTALIAAIGFGTAGRIFTRKTSGWLLALTAIPWGAVAAITTFVVFSRQGNIEPFNPAVPVASGLVGVIAALLPYRGVPRIIGFVATGLVIVAAVLLMTLVP